MYYHFNPISSYYVILRCNYFYEELLLFLLCLFPINRNKVLICLMFYVSTLRLYIYNDFDVISGVS